MQDINDTIGGDRSSSIVLAPVVDLATRILLAAGSLCTGFGVFIATFAAIVRTGAALPATSIAALYLVSLGSGAVLCAPFFARPPARARLRPWLVRVPIPFAGIVLRPLGRIGFEIQRAPWAIVQRSHPTSESSSEE